MNESSLLNKSEGYLSRFIIFCVCVIFFLWGPIFPILIFASLGNGCCCLLPDGERIWGERRLSDCLLCTSPSCLACVLPGPSKACAGWVPWMCIRVWLSLLS